MDSRTSLTGCHMEPSSSHEYIEGSASLPLKKKHHFTKHNPVANLKNYFHNYHHHNNNDKRGRTESSVSEVVAPGRKNSHSVPTTPTGSRPYALSTTSAPESAGGENAETSSKKSALSRLCQVSFNFTLRGPK